MSTHLDSVLTERQSQYLAKYRELRSFQEVADFFGVKRDSVAEVIKSAKRKSEAVAFEVDLIQLQAKKSSNNTDTANSTELMELIERQGFRCALTGQVIDDPSTASLDHIEPVSNGGNNKIDNLQWVLNDVNIMKGTFSQKRFIEICCMVAEYTQRSIPQKEAAQTGPWCT
jgi:predicted DNA-binding protein YlxM (UPF0122 family)